MENFIWIYSVPYIVETMKYICEAHVYFVVDPRTKQRCISIFKVEEILKMLFILV